MHIDKELINKIGVYAIVNKVNGKYYIGSTAVGFGKRIRDHLKELRGNRHRSRHLQQSYNKYGENNFCAIVLNVCDNPDDCLVLEQKYLDIRLGLFREETYNISPTAGSVFGMKHSKEFVDRCAKYYDVVLKAPDGRLVNGVFNLKHFCIENNLSRQHMREIVELKRVSHKGWILIEKNGITVNVKDTRLVNDGVGFISPDGDVFHVKNGLKAFALEHGLTAKRLSSLKCGALKSHRGWRLYSNQSQQ